MSINMAISGLEIDRQQLKQLLNRFLEINRKRKTLLEQNVSENEWSVIELLPFLFHVNHPMLPGYVSAETPCGLANYQPNRLILQLAKKYAKSLDYKPRAAAFYHIESVFLMGSAGSVAHSGQSDLDVWVCFSEKLSPDQIQLLKKKRDKIQRWAFQQAIDCSIYLVTQSRILDATAEQTKHTMGHGLLLDEFYRTQVYLEGRHLLWWVIPLEWEERYDEYKRYLLDNRFTSVYDWIDFGSVSSISLEDYINNALWYINKALTSPYKTALKLVLMESYISQYPNIKPISFEYKKFVHNLMDNTTVIDAYLLMHREVEQYLIQNDQSDRLEFVRRCLYQKIHLNQAQLQNRQSESHKIVAELINEWGWSAEKKQLFDQRNQWDINQIGNEKRLYIKQLITSFRVIGQFIRQHPDFFEKYKDSLLCLSRKISAHLELSESKIEKVNINFVPHLTDKHLSLVRQTKGKDRELWSFYDRAISQQEATSSEPAYQCNSLLELMVWAKTNGLLNENTSIQYRDVLQQLQYDELERLTQVLLRDTFDETDIDDRVYRKKPIIQSVNCFINVAHDKLTLIARQGMHIITSQNDPFCFGNECHNLIETIDIHYRNNWGEQFVVHFGGDDSMLQAGVALLELMHRQNRSFDIKYYSFSSMRSEQLVSRVKQLFRQLFQFYSTPTVETAKYFLRLGRIYISLQSIQGKLSIVKADDELALFELMLASKDEHQRINFDARCFLDPVVRVCLQQAQPGKNNLLLSVNEGSPSMCLVDEFGSLNYISLEKANVDSQINTLLQLLKNSVSDFTVAIYQMHDDHSVSSWELDPGTQSDKAMIELDVHLSENRIRYELKYQRYRYSWSPQDPGAFDKLNQWLDRAAGVSVQDIDFRQIRIHSMQLPTRLLIAPSRILYERLRFQNFINSHSESEKT